MMTPERITELASMAADYAWNEHDDPDNPYLDAIDALTQITYGLMDDADTQEKEDEVCEEALQILKLYREEFKAAYRNALDNFIEAHGVRLQEGIQ